MERLEARVSPEMKRLFVAAAELQGRTLTDFILAAASEKAASVINEHSIINVTGADQIVFAESMVGPAADLPELAAAIDEYERRVD